MKKKFKAVFGGSFDPPHRGHLRLIDSIVVCDDVEEVYVVPTLQNPFKSKSTTSYNIRCEMTEAVIDSRQSQWSKSVTVKRDIPEPHTNIDTVYSAIRTLDILKKDEPDSQFKFVVGMDCVADFDKWVDYRRILDEYGLIIVQRGISTDYDIPDYLTDHPNVSVVQISNPSSISSTEIRELIAEKRYTRCVRLMPSVILDYISKYRLYGYQPDKPRFYKSVSFVKDDLDNAYAGKIWETSYMKTYTDVYPINTLTGQSRPLVKMLTFPNLELDINVYMYRDLTITDVDDMEEITEEEYLCAVDSFLIAMESIVISEQLMGAVSYTDADAEPDERLSEPEAVMWKLRRWKMDYPIKNEYGFYRKDIKKTDSQQCWTTVYTHPIAEYIDKNGELCYIMTAFSIPNSDETDNNTFIFVAGKALLKSELETFDEISRDEYIDSYNIFNEMINHAATGNQ